MNVDIYIDDVIDLREALTRIDDETDDLYIKIQNLESRLASIDGCIGLEEGN
jgi:hypothetical protein